MKYWFGVLCLFAASIAAYAGIWTAHILGAIGLYFVVSTWIEEWLRDRKP